VEQPPPATTVAEPPNPQLVQLVNSLVRPTLTHGGLTPDQSLAWRTNLALLVQSGSSAIPAIREFLNQNADLDFGHAGQTMLGYRTVRLALLDALAQMPGGESVQALREVLHTTADPREIAVLARYLETAEPGSHRQTALDAARQSLSMANEGHLADRDVAPLFEVLQNFGNASTTQDLQKSANKWNYYSMFALANLPEGAGIPELVKIVQGETTVGSGSRVPALEMVAQAASQSELARQALVDQARQGNLTPYNWATLESILAGDRVGYQESAYQEAAAGVRPSEVKRTHISSGNQNFYSAPPPGGLTTEQAAAQSALISELMAVTKDPSGVETLERARRLLARRTSNVGSDTASGN
jgi:hypothetical protein